MCQLRLPKRHLTNIQRPNLCLQGKDAVPESVDHVLVRVDPKEDRTWLQSEPAVATDNAHALDKTGA